jgi:hypothetical protein
MAAFASPLGRQGGLKGLPALRVPDDFDHFAELRTRDEAWLASPRREEIFGPLGITHQTFLDPENPNRAAIFADVPTWTCFKQ